MYIVLLIATACLSVLNASPPSPRLRSLRSAAVALQVCELDQETDGEELEDAAKDISGYDTIPILFIGGHAVGTCDGEQRDGS